VYQNEENESRWIRYCKIKNSVFRIKEKDKRADELDITQKSSTKIKRKKEPDELDIVNKELCLSKERETCRWISG
jgi:hypothetical protein